MQKVTTAFLCKPLDNGTFVINRGFSNGINTGDIFYLPDGEKEPIIDPINEQHIGYHQYEVARFSVSYVFENHSFVTPIDIPWLNQRKGGFFSNDPYKDIVERDYTGKILFLVPA